MTRPEGRVPAVHKDDFWLRVHLAGCRDCRRFRYQLAVLAGVGLPVPEDGLGEVGLSDAGRSRIGAALAEAPDES